MPLYASRVKETATTTGTGTFTLAGAVTGYRTFSSIIPVGSKVEYVIEAVDGSGVPTGQWEEGEGTLLTSTTLGRTELLASSTGAFVDFAAGTKNVFLTLSATMVNQLETIAVEFNFKMP
jgi:hypothetical protein